MSHNELWLLLRRSFESLYGHNRDYYDIARTVWWLECYGHCGLDRMIAALPKLTEGGDHEPILTELSSTHGVIDCGGHSLFCIGRSICDLGMAFAAEKGFMRLDLENVEEGNPLIGVLNYAANQGFCAGVSGSGTFAIIEPFSDCPTVYRDDACKALSFICAQNREGLNRYRGQTLERSLSIPTQKDFFNVSLQNGLMIDSSHYDILTALADRVLVESSEASRRGAGE